MWNLAHKSRRIWQVNKPFTGNRFSIAHICKTDSSGGILIQTICVPLHRHATSLQRTKTHTQIKNMWGDMIIREDMWHPNKTPWHHHNKRQIPCHLHSHQRPATKTYENMQNMWEYVTYCDIRAIYRPSGRAMKCATTNWSAELLYFLT